MAGDAMAMKANVDATGYAQFLAPIKVRVSRARSCAARAVNHELALLYWDSGRGIVEEGQAAGWGGAVVARLSADLLAAFPDMRGFSAANLWRMKQIYLTRTSADLLAQAARDFRSAPRAADKADFLTRAVQEMVAAVPWGHHVLLPGRSLKATCHLYSLRATANVDWSRNVPVNQVKALAYPLDDLRKGVQAVGGRKLPHGLWAEVEQKPGWCRFPWLNARVCGNRRTWGAR